MTGSPQALVEELTEARLAFFTALDRLDPNTPLTAEWGARELVAHLGYWVGHAAETIHAVHQGRIDEFEVGGVDTDERNATVARVARQTNLATIRRREEASVEALRDRLATLDAALLATRLPDGDTLEAAIRDDGPDHYREHLEELPAP